MAFIIAQNSGSDVPGRYSSFAFLLIRPQLVCLEYVVMRSALECLDYFKIIKSQVYKNKKKKRVCKLCKSGYTV